MRLAVPRVLIVASATVLLPQAAQAHSAFEGAGNFYGGLLHPLLVPAEALSIAAAALLMGTSGLRHSQAGVLATAVGLAIGLTVMQLHPVDRDLTSVLLAVALLAGVAVAGGLRPAVPIAATLVFVIGFAVGADAAPESGKMSERLAATAGTIAGGTFLTAAIAVLALGREVFWQRIAIRIGGSWIAAISMLYLAWQASQAGR